MIRMTAPTARKSFNNLRGYSYVEAIIYLGILCLVLIMVLAIVNEMFIQHVKTRGSFVVWDNLSFAKQRFAYALRNAETVNVPPGGQSGSVLTLGMSATNTYDNVTFLLTNGQITMARGGEAPVWLTSPEVTVTNLTFETMQSSVPVVKYTLSAKLNSADPRFQTVMRTDGLESLSH